MKYLQQLGFGFLAASLALTAHAQMPPPGDGPAIPPGIHAHGMPPHLPPLPPSIRLSEEQQDKVFDIMHAAAPAWREQAKAIRHAEEELKKLAVSERTDDGTARAAAERLGQAVVEMRLLRLRGERQILAILTPEQRRQFTEEQQKIKEWRGLPPPPARFADGQPPCEMPPHGARKPTKSMP